MTRKKAAKIFLWIALIAWSIPFVIDIFRGAPYLFDVDDLIHEGLSTEEIESMQFRLTIIFEFFVPPSFLVGVMFFCGIYHWSKGNGTRTSTIIRILYVIISFLTLSFLFFVLLGGKLIHLTDNNRVEMIVFLNPIVFFLPVVFLFDMILEIIAFNLLDRRRLSDPNHN